MAIDIKSLLEDLKKGKITLEEAESKIVVARQKYPVGYTRYELVLYKDVKTNEGWNTVMVPVVPKTTDISEVKKVIPNAEKLLKEAEEKQKQKEEGE
jgi:hypothetical protein